MTHEWRAEAALIGMAIFIVATAAVAIMGLASITDWGYAI